MGIFDKTVEHAADHAAEAGGKAVEGVLDHVEDETLPAAVAALKALMDHLDVIVKKKRIKVLIEVYDETGPDQP